MGELHKVSKGFSNRKRKGVQHKKKEARCRVVNYSNNVKSGSDHVLWSGAMAIKGSGKLGGDKFQD